MFERGLVVFYGVVGLLSLATAVIEPAFIHNGRTVVILLAVVGCALIGRTMWIIEEG